MVEHSQWQSLLKLGNECFDDKQLNQAEALYWQAYDLLSLACHEEPQSSDVLMAWICACHNLAALYETFGNLDLSLKFLMAPHEYLITVSESNHFNDDIKFIAFKGMSVTLPPILLFIKSYKICEGCREQQPTLQKIIEQEAASVH
jgi:hypothetical protein